jgi:hypothetical protein
MRLRLPVRCHPSVVCDVDSADWSFAYSNFWRRNSRGGRTASTGSSTIAHAPTARHLDPGQRLVEEQVRQERLLGDLIRVQPAVPRRDLLERDGDRSPGSPTSPGPPRSPCRSCRPGRRPRRTGDRSRRSGGSSCSRGSHSRQNGCSESNPVFSRGTHSAPVGTSTVPFGIHRVSCPDAMNTPSSARGRPVLGRVERGALQLDREHVLPRPHEHLLRRRRVLLMEPVDVAVRLVRDRQPPPVEAARASRPSSRTGTAPPPPPSSARSRRHTDRRDEPRAVLRRLERRHALRILEPRDEHVHEPALVALGTVPMVLPEVEALFAVDSQMITVPGTSGTAFNSASAFGRPARTRSPNSAGNARSSRGRPAPPAPCRCRAASWPRFLSPRLIAMRSPHQNIFRSAEFWHVRERRLELRVVRQVRVHRGSRSRTAPRRVLRSCATTSHGGCP